MKIKSYILKFVSFLCLIFITNASQAAVPDSFEFLLGFNGNIDGRDNSKFSFPTGVAIDASGQIYVSDINVDNVQVFDSTGAWLFAFDGTAGGGTQFIRPYSVGVDPSGQIYVSDTGLDNVQVFDPSGSFLFAFDGTLGGGTQFVAPWGVAVDDSGQIYVSDFFLGNVQVFDPSGSFLFVFNGTIVGGTPFITPYGVAVDASGSKVYVSDVSLDLVQVYGTPSSDIKVSASSRKNVFLTQSEFYNVIRWSTPGDVLPTHYQVFRDGTLIATVPVGNKLAIEDHNRKKGTTYSYLILAKNGNGTIG